jgi:hypothetical protein
MKSLFLSLILTFAISNIAVISQNLNIRGIVFLDKNNNGVFDNGEPGLKNIPVSNGDTICLTNRKGGFEIKAERLTSLFPILPSGYTIPGTIKNAQFIFFPNQEDKQSFTVLFPLVKEEQPPHFKIGAIGDIQIDNLQEVHYANQTIMAELASRNDLNFNMILGDLVNDNIQMQPYIKGMLNRLPTPSWTIYGNHDRNLNGNVQDSVFNSYYAASHYAFNYSDVHFIVLNNIYPKGKRAYEGRVSDKQLRFIVNDLALVPVNRLIVVCQHIPMAFTKNKEEVLSLLQDRKVLILSGHTHQIGRHFFSKNVSELVTGTTCGSWWTGERDVMGIPNALMQDGSPRNYFVIDFEKNNFHLSFKGVGLDKRQQMTIWISKQDTIDQHIRKLKEIPSGVVLANIYGACDSTMVFMKINSGKWTKMEQVLQTTPYVNRMVFMNSERVYPTKYSKRIPMRNSPSPHLWKGKVDESLSDKINTIQIKAADNYGFEATSDMLFIGK